MLNNGLYYKNLLDNLKIGVFRSLPGPQGRFLFGNKSFEQMIGFAGKDLLKLGLNDIFADHKKYDLLMKQARKKGGIHQEQVILKRRDRKIIWCVMSMTAVPDASGRVQYYDAMVEDISAQKTVERELLESKELFRVVFENSAVAITVTDKDERIMAWNPFAERMLEMSKGDLFNKPVKDLYPLEEWQRLRGMRIREKGMLADITTRVIKKDGSLLDVNMSISVLKDSMGNVIGSIGIIRDITRQKLFENKLRESENRVRVILDNSAAAITLTDNQERIILWNTYTEHLLGMDKQDLTLCPVDSLYPPEEWKKIREENIRQKGSKHHLETKIRRKDGKMIDIDLSINVLKDTAGQVIGSVGIMQDITNQKKIRQMLLQAKLAAEEANNAKSLFLAKMSHEVRTPMNAIIGMLDLTLDTELSDEQKENLKVAKDASEALLKLINDILDLSKAEAGKITIESIEMNVYDIIKNVCKGLTVLARNKQIDLVWSIDEKVPHYLIGDPVRLRQVIVNLVNNAIKFTHKGRVEVTVQLLSKKETDCELLFSVRDTGIGIPKEKHETVFEVFSQADSETSRRYGGSGLGLAICKKLVELMGGHIWVESKEHQGSAFNFTLVYTLKPEQTSGIAAQDSADSGSRHAHHVRILVAEDNAVNQKIVVKILEKKGWSVQVANNGREVLDFLKTQTYDVILMDDYMPELDGVETTRVIRNEEKQSGQHIPIVAMTAHAMAGDREKYLKSGMDGYVSKPIDREALYNEVSSLIQKRTAGAG